MKKELIQALKDVRSELWINFCEFHGTETPDKKKFNKKTEIKIIDKMLRKVK